MIKGSLSLMRSLVDILCNIVISSALLGMRLNHFTERKERKKKRNQKEGVMNKQRKGVTDTKCRSNVVKTR